MKTQFWLDLCTKYDLGVLSNEPLQIIGGLTHRMFKIQTNKNTYIVKLLNPNIMKRDTALSNFKQADYLEEKLEENNIPIISSLTFNNTKMQLLDGQYFYVFKWYDGKSLKDNQIEKKHCKKIGEILAKIHNINMKEDSISNEPMNIDWNNYLMLMQNNNKEIYNLLKDNLDLLYKHMNLYNSSISKVPNLVTICHNDLDSKNVLWIEDDFKLIDLECLSYASPYLELFQLALCWSGYETCNLNLELLQEFVDAYFDNIQLPLIDWNTMYDFNMGRLEWLEFSLKRTLMIECNTKEEQEIGIHEAIETIEHIVYYEKEKNKILSCFQGNN